MGIIGIIILVILLFTIFTEKTSRLSTLDSKQPQQNHNETLLVGCNKDSDCPGNLVCAYHSDPRKNRCVEVGNKIIGYEEGKLT